MLIFCFLCKVLDGIICIIRILLYIERGIELNCWYLRGGGLAIGTDSSPFGRNNLEKNFGVVGRRGGVVSSETDPYS